jgi:hypothetical protein
MDLARKLGHERPVKINPGSRAVRGVFINEMLMIVGGALTTLMAMVAMVRPKNRNPFVAN